MCLPSESSRASGQFAICFSELSRFRCLKLSGRLSPVCLTISPQVRTSRAQVCCLPHLVRSSGVHNHTSWIAGIMCYFLYWIIQFPFLLVSPQKIRWLFMVKVSPCCQFDLSRRNYFILHIGYNSSRHLDSNVDLGVYPRSLLPRIVQTAYIAGRRGTELGVAECSQQCVRTLQHIGRQYSWFYCKCASIMYW